MYLINIYPAGPIPPLLHRAYDSSSSEDEEDDAPETVCEPTTTQETVPEVALDTPEETVCDEELDITGVFESSDPRNFLPENNFLKQ